MGREFGTVEIPCTWRAKNYKCGDIIAITHELLPDTVRGVIGMTARLAIVVGRKLRLTGGGVDVITARLGPVVTSGGIAPCVLLSSDDAGAEGTCAVATLYSPTGVSDLSWFEAGHRVRLIEFDSTAPTETNAIILSIVGAAVTFTAGVFGAGQPTPCWMVPADWDTSDHTTFAYVGDHETYPTLGAGSDTGMEWVI